MEDYDDMQEGTNADEGPPRLYHASYLSGVGVNEGNVEASRAAPQADSEPGGMDLDAILEGTQGGESATAGADGSGAHSGDDIQGAGDAMASAVFVASAGAGVALQQGTEVQPTTTP